MAAVAPSLREREQDVVAGTLKLLERVESRIVAGVILRVEEKGWNLDLMQPPNRLSLLVILVESLRPLVTEEGNDGVLVHVHHTEPILVQSLVENLKLLLFNVRLKLFVLGH